MKIIASTIFAIVISFNCYSQDYTTFSIIAKGFILSNRGKEEKVNKLLQVTYNSQQTLLYIEGEGVKTFRNVNYSNTLQNGGWYNESWVSDETPTTDFGHWGLNVQKLKTGTFIQISFKNEITYYSNNTVFYSEAGKITQNAIVKNWKELFAKQKLQDSLKHINEILLAKENNRNKTLDSLLTIYPYVELTLNIKDKLVKNIKSAAINSNVKCWIGWVVKVDWVNGIITDALPDRFFKGCEIEVDNVPKIKKALIGQHINGTSNISTSFSHINFIL